MISSTVPMVSLSLVVLTQEKVMFTSGSSTSHRVCKTHPRSSWLEAWTVAFHGHGHGYGTGNDSIGNIARLSEVSITLAMVRFLASFTTIQGPCCIGTVVMERYVRWSEDGSTDHHLNSTSVMQFVVPYLTAQDREYVRR